MIGTRSAQLPFYLTFQLGFFQLLFIFHLLASWRLSAPAQRPSATRDRVCGSSGAARAASAGRREAWVPAAVRVGMISPLIAPTWQRHCQSAQEEMRFQAALTRRAPPWDYSQWRRPWRLPLGSWSLHAPWGCTRTRACFHPGRGAPLRQQAPVRGPQGPIRRTPLSRVAREARTTGALRELGAGGLPADPGARRPAADGGMLAPVCSRQPRDRRGWTPRSGAGAGSEGRPATPAAGGEDPPFHCSPQNSWDEI